MNGCEHRAQQKYLQYSKYATAGYTVAQYTGTHRQPGQIRRPSPKRVESEDIPKLLFHVVHRTTQVWSFCGCDEYRIINKASDTGIRRTTRAASALCEVQPYLTRCLYPRTAWYLPPLYAVCADVIYWYIPREMVMMHRLGDSSHLLLLFFFCLFDIFSFRRTMHTCSFVLHVKLLLIRRASKKLRFRTNRKPPIVRPSTGQRRTGRTYSRPAVYRQ